MDTIRSTDLNELTQEWEELSEEFNELEECNNKYKELLDKFIEHQQICLENAKRKRNRIADLKNRLEICKIKGGSVDEISKLKQKIFKREVELSGFEKKLPMKSGHYLQILLGNICVSILNKDEKILYKNDYEKFKMLISLLGVLLPILNLIFSYRVLEFAYLLMVVWYYCTLTIRESILKVNGSRISGWWRAQHFISAIASSTLLVWPQGEHWQLFRSLFMYFNMYLSLLQYVQLGYQKGLLYRLKALGEIQYMDITVDCFHSRMWRGLGFLLPFILAGDAFQFYIVWTLYKLTFVPPSAPAVVPVIGMLFLTLCLGNIITTSSIVLRKILESKKH